MSQQNPDDEPTPLDSTDGEEPIAPDSAAGEVEEPISLVESSGPSQVRQSRTLRDRATAKTDYDRPLNITGTGATRCRVFHSKVSVAALEMMQQQINAWLDCEHVEIKHIGQTLGIMQGKTAEENLIVTVWY